MPVEIGSVDINLAQATDRGKKLPSMALAGVWKLGGDKLGGGELGPPVPA